jgi:hypothetical protein
MSERDPFQRGQEATEAVRRELEALREDARALVRDEVERAGMPRSELQRLVAEAVRREVASRGSAAPAWRSVGLVALGSVIGVLAGALGYAALAGPGDVPASSPGEPARDAATVAAIDSPAPAPPPPTPEERAALYDSLFAAREGGLEPLVAALETGGAAVPVVEAAGAWRAGGDLTAVQARRLHDALVQAALNATTGSSLRLDGFLTRDPCAGDSCGALLELWRVRGGELGMPPLPERAASATDILALVEKVLVLSRMETGGG